MPSCLVIAGRHREMIQLPEPPKGGLLILNIVVHQGNLVVDADMIMLREPVPLKETQR